MSSWKMNQKFHIGDLVYVREPITESTRHPGLIIDALEDDVGTVYFEVEFIGETGWFESYQIKEVKE